MKEQWKFDEFAKVLSKVEGDRSVPVQVDLPYNVQVQPKAECSKKILIILRILMLAACLSLLCWLSIRLYSDYTTFQSASKYPLKTQTWVSKIIIDESPKEDYNWTKDVNKDLFTAVNENEHQKDTVKNNYKVAKFLKKPNEVKSKKFTKQEFIKKMLPNITSLETSGTKVNLAVAGVFSLMKSLVILEKHSFGLNRHKWICMLLENETKEAVPDVLEFIEVSRPLTCLYETVDCEDVNNGKEKPSNILDVFAEFSMIVDSEANLLLAKYLEPRVGDIFKLLVWYFNNRDSQFYKNSKGDIKVLTAKLLFDTSIIKYRETLDQLRKIIEQDKDYEKDYEKMLSGTLHHFEVDSTFQIIMMGVLYMKTAAERLYTYDIINEDTLTYVLPVINKVIRDDYISNFGDKKINTPASTSVEIVKNVK